MGSAGIASKKPAPLLTYYGDDFTGSTDVMEALSSQGIETVLFLGMPSETLFDRFAHFRAFGIAGASRSETPQWMEKNLTPAFEWLKSLGAAICHYKVCSTFDSSPNIGNIGKAIEIGRAVFGTAPVPLVVGAPQIRRYTAFGHLFAAFRGEVFRIDRHPVMSRHPVTPMAEADLRLHLANQTQLATGLVDLATLRSSDADERVDALFDTGTEIILIDVADHDTQGGAGHQLWRKIRPEGRFVCGSSGVEYALVEEWRRLGLTQDVPHYEPPGPVERMAVVSGSVSPTTERQIRHAIDVGFAGIAIDPLQLAGAHADGAVSEAARLALAALAEGRSPILYTALGPSADHGAVLSDNDGARHRIGRNLGRILRRIVEQAGLRRSVIAGGDTSSHALSQMGIDALTLRLPLPQTPGSPLCTAHAASPAIDGMEIALKGGQVGSDDYFSMIRAGQG
ncbi:four-carbon acid sugar kinase family protein [Rhizobium sp. TRM95111]|uniref:four-carbon acid sugar kinase family protein n=1 Tax=Rhizobium alarense TaxID=2846851 RepID=UPI001F1ED825|nr:four-carbon acid sugar kinase family protein [Rhizobium alarense]MCF3640247.1 four-carbon acid sugar kinase family protein [Rhizobium alarense]